MKRLAAAWLIVGVFATPGVADLVILKDGRTFEGTVSESEGGYVIELPYGSIRVSAAEVGSIERCPSPLEMFEGYQSTVDRNDPDELARLAEWARDKGLPRQAEDLLEAAVELDVDNATARRLLGYVRADGKWMKAAEGVVLAERWLANGRADELLGDLVPALELVVSSELLARRVTAVKAGALLESGQFVAAMQVYERLAQESRPPESIRFSAIASILRSHTDGMYVLSEPSPPLAMLLAEGETVVAAGPASLAAPTVLAAALRDKAKESIDAARATMDEARRQEPTDPDAAKAKYDLAGKSLDKADALVAGISRSYRIEIVRRRISMISKRMNVAAGQFDTLKEELGKRDLTPITYAGLVGRMLAALNSVRLDLDAILEQAGPYDRELVLEITDATMRRERVEALREVLTQELGGLYGKR